MLGLGDVFGLVAVKTNGWPGRRCCVLLRGLALTDRGVDGFGCLGESGGRSKHHAGKTLPSSTSDMFPVEPATQRPRRPQSAAKG